MTRHIILAAGQGAETRLAAAQVLARENRWPLLDVDLLGTTSNLVSAMWTQVDADVDGVVLTAPFDELADPEWLDELNYDLALRGYEATVVYLLSVGEPEPILEPEHYLIDAYAGIDSLFTAATHLAIELR